MNHLLSHAELRSLLLNNFQLEHDFLDYFVHSQEPSIFFVSMACPYFSLLMTTAKNVEIEYADREFEEIRNGINHKVSENLHAVEIRRIFHFFNSYSVSCRLDMCIEFHRVIDCRIH